jgi:hypothetical protein
MGCKAVQFGKRLTFRRNISPPVGLVPASGCLWLGLLLDPEDGGNMSLRNVRLSSSTGCYKLEDRTLQVNTCLIQCILKHNCKNGSKAGEILD